MNDVKEGPQLIDLEQFAGQGTGQVKAEAVDVHLQHPVAQAIHDQLQDARMLHVRGVATTREVHVITRVFW